jgi:hypothetical protein
MLLPKEEGPANQTHRRLTPELSRAAKRLRLEQIVMPQLGAPHVDVAVAVNPNQNHLAAPIYENQVVRRVKFGERLGED